MKKKIFILILLLVSMTFTSVKAEEVQRTLINMDYPYINQETTDSLKIQGWVMSTVNTNVEVYVDDTLIEVDRKERPDVLNAVQGYGDITTNPTPGIYKIIDISNYSYGNHTVKVRVLDSENNVIDEVIRSFNKTYPKTLLNIDYPSLNQEVTDSLRIYGWVMSTANTNVEVYVDDILTEVDRQEREDVLNAVQGYGDITTNPTPGIYKIVDINNLSYGNHIVKVRVLDSENNIINEYARQFRKGSPKTLINIDYPSLNQEVTDSLRIQGWVMSTANTNVEVYIDDILTEIDRKERPDVLNAVKGYGDINTNPTPGIYKIVDISNLSYGNHTLKVRILDSENNIINEYTRNFRKGSPRTLTHIDYPSVNQEVTDSLRIYGWVMSTAKADVKVYIDDSLVEVDRQQRPDVLNAVKGYGDINTNPTPGIYKIVDISNLGYGNHTVKVKMLDNDNNVIIENTRQFRKTKPKTLTHIDFPSVNQEVTDNLRIYGWIMSTANTNIEVYVDNSLVEVDRQQRPDVLNAVKGYGDISTNPTPGIYKVIDISNLGYGNHTVKVMVLDNGNNVVDEVVRQFRKIYPKTLTHIDFPSVNQEVTDNLRIYGWIMSTANTEVKVYIDDFLVEVDRKERPDVLNAVKGYGDINTNPTPGIYKILDISNLKYGNHTLSIKVFDRSQNELVVQNINFKRKKPKSMIVIDYPQNISYRNVLIAGWYMAMENNTHAEIYFDDTKVDSVHSSKRDDALNAYSEYKPYMENQNPGFQAIYDATSLDDGTHKVTIKIINDQNNDVISTLSKNFTLQKYKGMIVLDYPALANINKDFSIIGWEMSELDNSYLKIYFDNNDISSTVRRFERPDVLNAVQGYGDASMNATPGFETQVSIANINEGKHTIKIELYTKQNDKIATLIKDIYIYSNIYNGIDISEFNHVTSWQSVKAAGIDYVIARAVVRGYGTEGRLMLDPTFTLNVSQATMNGLKVGAYVYSQATTVEEGIQEVNAMIQQVNLAGGKTKVTLPLVIDTEFSGCGGRCGRADNLSTEQRTAIIKAMAEAIKANGYTPMIYASTSFLNNQLDMSQLREYSVWVAHYGVSQPSYQGPYEIWQYASDGYVPGISGYVDMDYFYKRY